MAPQQLDSIVTQLEQAVRYSGKIRRFTVKKMSENERGRCRENLKVSDWENCLFSENLYFHIVIAPTCAYVCVCLQTFCRRRSHSKNEKKHINKTLRFAPQCNHTRTCNVFCKHAVCKSACTQRAFCTSTT